MKTLLRSILIGLLIGNTALAGLPPTNIQGQSDASPKTKFSFQVPYNQFTDLGGVKALLETGNKNVLTNASFESSSYSSGWTLTTVPGSVETATVVDGKQAAKLAFGNTLGDIAQSVTSSVNTASQNWEASCKVNTTMTTIQVCALSGGTEVNCVNAPSSGTWQQVTSNFIGPANGTSVGVRVKTSSSNIGNAYVDDCYVGPARNLSQVSQAQFYGSLTWSSGGSTSWSTAATTYADFSAGSNYSAPVAVGSITATGTVLPHAVANNAPNQSYRVTYVGRMGNDYTSGAKTFSCRLVDDLGSVLAEQFARSGTGLALWEPLNLDGTITYTTSGSHTFKVQCAGSSGTTYLGGDSSQQVMNVFAFPSQSQTALRPDQTPASWSGYQNGISSGCSTSSASLIDPSACTGIGVTQTTARNITCSQSGTGPAIACNLARTGTHTITARVTVNSAVASGTAARLVDGSGTVIDPGASFTVAGTNYQQTVTLRGKYLASSATPTFKVQLASNGSTASITQGFATGAAAIQWDVDEGDAPLGAPYLVGSVTSNTSGQERVEHADINLNGTTCSVNGQSGSWITGASRPSSRRCTLTVAAGIFSSANYHCTCSASTGAFGSCGLAQDVVTKTATTFQILTDTTLLDNPFSIICMGAR